MWNNCPSKEQSFFEQLNSDSDFFSLLSQIKFLKNYDQSRFILLLSHPYNQSHLKWNGIYQFTYTEEAQDSTKSKKSDFKGHTCHSNKRNDKGGFIRFVQVSSSNV